MKKIYSIPSAFGGHNYYDESGNQIGYSIPGIGGSEDYFGTNGERGYSVDSVLSGKDYYSNKGNAYSVPSLFGGETIHGDISGYSLSSPFGGEDYMIDD